MLLSGDGPAWSGSGFSRPGTDLYLSITQPHCELCEWLLWGLNGNLAILIEGPAMAGAHEEPRFRQPENGTPEVGAEV